MAATPPSPWPRRIRRIAIVFLSLLAVAALLFVSFSPAVEAGPRPTARDIEAARGVWRQLKAAQGAGATARVHADNRAIRGLTALASDATGIARFEAEVSQGVLSGRTSISLPAGLWVNASATVTGQHTGFPAYRLKVGRVAFPPTASRWIADLGRWVLRLNGASIPPLDEMVRHVSINRQDMLAELALPASTGAVDGLLSAAGKSLDEPLVSDIYCRIAAAQRTDPVTDLSQLVRRTFDDAHAEKTGDYSRAAFVALSFLVVGEMAEALAPEAAEMKKDCPHPRRPFVLHRREDLAKHWAFSAALTSVLGEETAASLGEWKELDDSLANGSGFSFVDIAADRAGMRTALQATDPGSAPDTIGALGRATDQVGFALQAQHVRELEARLAGLDAQVAALSDAKVTLSDPKVTVLRA